MRRRSASKRARTAGSNGIRDCSDLGDGPASLVAERVLAGDVVGYVWFRAVCRAWRRCCDDPRTRGGGVLDDPRLRPRQWIMLLDEVGENLVPAAAAAHRCRRRFLNVSTGHCVHVYLPELVDHGILRSTAADGLLFLHSKSNRNVIRLLNPVRRQAGDFPPLTTLGTIQDYFDICSANKIGLADDRTAWLKLSSGTLVAFAKPGDQRWLLIDLDSVARDLPSPHVFFAGRFYGVTKGAIVSMDTTTTKPRLVVAAKLDLQFWGTWKRMTVHLVDNGGGKLMLVHRAFHRGGGYKVYRVNLAARKVTTRGGVGLSLGRRAVFIGQGHAISVCPQAFPSVEANTVYPGLCLSERRHIGAYRIRDGSIDSFGYDDETCKLALPRPWTIADCLAVYVSAYDAS